MTITDTPTPVLGSVDEALVAGHAALHGTKPPRLGVLI